MKQEDKKLLQCLCEMLPHGLFVAVKETDDGSTMVPLYDEDGNIDETNEPNIHSLVSCNCYGECDIDDYSTVTVNEITPYLRPMESMTDEEREELMDLCDITPYETQGLKIDEYGAGVFLNGICSVNNDVFDWLNRKMLDYRGLIPEGQALPAPEGMYK